MENDEWYKDILAANPLAPFLPAGKLLGKDSMVFAQSNEVLKALPLDNVSSGAQHLFNYLLAHAADEITKAVQRGTYDYSNTQVKKFFVNMKEYNDFCYSVGKKHYTLDELDVLCSELLLLPVDFMGDDEKINSHTVPIPSIKLDKNTGECAYEITNEFLRLWAPGLSAKGAEQIEQHYLSLKESFKFNGYQDRLYRFINGYMQTISSEYVISISLLKRRMGVKENIRAWDNSRFLERILTPTCEAINEKSDISFSWEVQRQGKSNRIKNIVFFSFKRKGKELHLDSKTIVDGQCKEMLPDKTLSGSSNVVKLNDNERKLATFIHLSTAAGMEFEEACEMYEFYKGDTDKFKKMISLYEEMRKAGVIKEENKSAFFRNVDIDNI